MPHDAKYYFKRQHKQTYNTEKKKEGGFPEIKGGWGYEFAESRWTNIW